MDEMDVDEMNRDGISDTWLTQMPWEQDHKRKSTKNESLI
jgi:hypothetical protein